MKATFPPIGSKQFRFTLGRQSRRRKLPVIGSVLDELVAWLRHSGYTESTIRTHVDSLDRLVRWLMRRRGPGLRGLTQLDLNAAYDWFQSHRLRVATVARTVGRFFRDHQIIPEGKEPPLPASERELGIYGEYLRQMRGLAESTIAGHQNRLRSFLKFLKFDQRPSVFRTLQAAQVQTSVKPLFRRKKSRKFICEGTAVLILE